MMKTPQLSDSTKLRASVQSLGVVPRRIALAIQWAPANKTKARKRWRACQTRSQKSRTSDSVPLVVGLIVEIARFPQLSPTVYNYTDAVRRSIVGESSTIVNIQ